MVWQQDGCFPVVDHRKAFSIAINYTGYGLPSDNGI